MNEELKFNELYDRITTKTPAHADSLNKIFDLLLENDNFLKYAADSLAEKMLEKGMIANNLVTDNTEMVLSAPMGKLLKQQLDEQNNNLENKIDLKNTGFFIGGNKHFAFLQIKQEQNVTRLQIESNEAKIYKSTDGAISFPYCERLISNTDFAKRISLNSESYININRNNVFKIGKFISMSISILQDAPILNETIVFSVPDIVQCSIIPFTTNKGKVGIVFSEPPTSDRTIFKIRSFNGMIEAYEEIYINGVIL